MDLQQERGKQGKEKEGGKRREGGDTSASLELYHDRQSKIDCAELHGQHA